MLSTLSPRSPGRVPLAPPYHHSNSCSQVLSLRYSTIISLCLRVNCQSSFADFIVTSKFFSIRYIYIILSEIYATRARGTRGRATTYLITINNVLHDTYESLRLLDCRLERSSVCKNMHHFVVARGLRADGRYSH